MAKIGFIGTGTIGSAIIKCLLKTYDKEEITYTDINPRAMERLEKDTGVRGCGGNVECVKNSTYVVLAIKPQFYDVVLDEIKDAVTDKNIIISLAPGVSIESVSERLHGHGRIVRCMPNTPALLGERLTAGKAACAAAAFAGMALVSGVLEIGIPSLSDGALSKGSFSDRMLSVGELFSAEEGDDDGSDSGRPRSLRMASSGVSDCGASESPAAGPAASEGVS